MSPVTSEPTSIAAAIARRAATEPDRVVLVHVAADGTERRFTWAELDRRSSQLAGALADRGLGFGDRLGIGLPNTPHFVLAAFAAWKLGAVPVPMRWDLPEWELERLRATIDGRVHLGVDDLGWIDATAERDVPDLPDVVSPHVSGLCSSGSTGTPKIIVSNRLGVIDPIHHAPFIELWGVKVPRPQTPIVLGPMYHINGFHGLSQLVGGDQVVVMERFDAALVVDLIERHRVTQFPCTPTMLKRIADLPGIDERDLSSIVWIMVGSAPMPPYLMHRWAELIGAEKIVMAYGSTEQLGMTAIRGDEWMAHEGTVGRPLPGTEVKILGPDGAEVPVGEIGDVYLRSSNFLGATYLGDATPIPMTDDGFGTVGDMGYVDGEGYLYLVDRRVDLIITGGANVFPAEVEMALMEHPGVADVVVIGLLDDEWGRRVHAVIEPADASTPPTFDDVRAWAKARLAAYKVPKSIEVVDAIPRSAATKVNRRALLDTRGG
jgi:bile acid-coenzyme A ligase